LEFEEGFSDSSTSSEQSNSCVTLVWFIVKSALEDRLELFICLGRVVIEYQGVIERVAYPLQSFNTEDAVTDPTNSQTTNIVSVNRREFLTVASVGIGGTAGCLSPSEENSRSESILIIENQRDSEQEAVIRFEDGDIVLFEETFRIAAGEQHRVEDDLSRGTTQVDVFVDVRSSGRHI
jgi:hypothetical protein